MNINKISNKIFKVSVDSKEDFNLDNYFDDLIFLEKKKILTFGDMNFRVFEKYFNKLGYNPEKVDLCFDDDKSIGLELPNTWYLNKGKHALSIAMYYNYLNFHAIVENRDLNTFNKNISDKYGKTACIEVYFEEELKQFLDINKIEYFGTPRTLTECVRYLEGWSVDKYPRLKGYITFSKFIELWSSINFPYFNSKEWYLGKEKSNQINKHKLTNVRKAVRYFWENYLLKYHRNISVEDIEIDILGGNKFHNIRSPKIILISEDLFSEDNSDYEIFGNLTKKLQKGKIYLSKKKNNFPEKNAKIASKLYPEALVLLIENCDKLRRNFSLLSPIKHAINEDTVIATKVLRYVIENYDKY